MGAFLLFYNLDGRLLWGDEAETALLARNITRFGLPRTDDGRNVITLYGPAVDGNAAGLWIWSPWLQEYVAAASFSLFGPSTWSARIPFVVIGFLSGVYLAFLTQRIYRNLALTCVATYLWFTSQLFLLHARQCRYYTIIVLAQLILAHGIYLMLAQKKRGIWLVALALVVQFYSNYIIVAANVPVLACLALIWRKRHPKLLGWMAAAGGMFALLVVPWLLYAKSLNQSHHFQTTMYWLDVGYYLSEVNSCVLPLVFLLLPLGAFLLRLQRATETNRLPARTLPADEITARWEWALLLFVPSFLLVVPLAPTVQVRYLLPLAPLLTILLVVWFFRYIPNVAAVILLALVLSMHNGASLLSGWMLPGGSEPRWRLINYVQSITTPYHDRTEGVVAFLKQAARPDQTVLVADPEFPLQFYLPVKILNILLPMKPLDRLPDWVLPESASSVSPLETVEVRREVRDQYEPIRIRVPCSNRGGSVPGWDDYEFFTAPKNYDLIIYKRKAAVR
jgi:hypothetical protein